MMASCLKSAASSAASVSGKTNEAESRSSTSAPRLGPSCRTVKDEGMDNLPVGLEHPISGAHYYAFKRCLIDENDHTHVATGEIFAFNKRQKSRLTN
jgi:hypothetical protein